MKVKEKVFGGNNRKKTRGRTVSTVEFEETRTIKQDMGFQMHKGTKYLVSINPQTGEKLYAKQGKAKKTDFIVTLPKNSVLTSKWGRKTWIEQEATSGKIGGLM